MRNGPGPFLTQCPHCRHCDCECNDGAAAVGCFFTLLIGFPWLFVAGYGMYYLLTEFLPAYVAAG